MIGAKKRFVVLQRDGFRCKYCGKNGRDVSLEVDHVIPKSLGGSDDLDNLQCICRECNIGKGARDLREGIVEMYKIKMDDAMKRLKTIVYKKLNENKIGTIDNTNKIRIHKFCELEIKGYKFNAHRYYLSGRYFIEEGRSVSYYTGLFEEGGIFCDTLLRTMTEEAEEIFESIIFCSKEEGYEFDIFKYLRDYCNNHTILSYK